MFNYSPQHILKKHEFLRHLPKTVMATAFASLGVSGAVNGQEAGASGDSSVLEEVVITARRFGENLQNAPVSVTAMTADYLQSQRMQEVQQVIEMTPGASFRKFNKGQMNFSMRGISSGGEGAAFDSAVMTVIDDVVIGKDALTNMKFFDVAQVEVLRGPQGTTFGRNASAGAIHIITQKPTMESEAWIEGTAGTDELLEVNAVVNGALGSSTAGRLAVHYDEREGYTEDLITGDPLDDVENMSLRGQLLFNPNEDLQVLFKVEYSEDDDAHSIRKAPDCTQPQLTPPFGNFTDSCDPYKTTTSESTDGPFWFEREITNISAKVDWAINDTLSLTSITGWVEADLNVRQDNYGTPYSVVYNISQDDVEQFTQEFRLDNGQSDSSITWMVGVFYLTDDHERIDEREILTFDSFLATTGDATTNNSTDSLGLFGQVNFELSDRLDLAVGGRYSKDEKDFDVYHEVNGFLNDIFIDPEETPISASAKENWDNISGSVSLTYRLNDSMMIYGLVSQGYKSGGFNGEPYTEEAATIPFDEETSLNIEAGAKMDLLDDRLRLNISVFDLTYDDLQVGGVLDSGTPIIENASGADVFGVELEATWLVTDYLTLMGSYANLDAEYNGHIADEDVSGNRTATSPEWTATLAALLEFPLANGSTLGFRADYRGRSDVYETPTEGRLRPGEDIYGALASWDSPENTWRLVVWGRNLTDEAEIVSVAPGGVLEQNPTGYGPPRTYGVTVRYNF